MPPVTHVFFDIGGVLGTNGWDREQRAAANARFGLGEEFESRHGEVVGEWEIGRLTLDEYLAFAVFYCPRAFDRNEFVGFMLSLSQPFDASVALAQRVAAAGKVRQCGRGALGRFGKGDPACRGSVRGHARSERLGRHQARAPPDRVVREALLLPFRKGSVLPENEATP